MLINVLILCFLTISSRSFGGNVSLNELSFVNGCKIFSVTGTEIKAFAGNSCIFLDDGSYLSSSSTSLRMISKSDVVNWEVPGQFDHLRLSGDGKRIITLVNSSDTGSKLMILSLTGKIIHQQTTAAILKKAKLKNWNKKGPLRPAGQFSSIHEINFDSATRGKSWFRPGYIIIGGSSLGIFVLDPTLEKISLHTYLPTAYMNAIHDVQVTQRGNFLYFNTHDRRSTEDNLFSSVQEYDPFNKKLIFDFTAKDHALFYSPTGGEVQSIDSDHFLFSDYLNGAFVYSKKKKDIVASIRGSNFTNREFSPSQRFKAYNLGSFLLSRAQVKVPLNPTKSISR